MIRSPRSLLMKKRSSCATMKALAQRARSPVSSCVSHRRSPVAAFSARNWPKLPTP